MFSKVVSLISGLSSKLELKVLEQSERKIEEILLKILDSAEKNPNAFLHTMKDEYLFARKMNNDVAIDDAISKEIASKLVYYGLTIEEAELFARNIQYFPRLSRLSKQVFFSVKAHLANMNLEFLEFSKLVEKLYDIKKMALDTPELFFDDQAVANLINSRDFIDLSDYPLVLYLVMSLHLRHYFTDSYIKRAMKNEEFHRLFSDLVTKLSDNENLGMTYLNKMKLFVE